MSTRRTDTLLPAVVPKRLGTMAAVLVVGIVVTMVVGAIVGGVNWLIAIGGAGTAAGTLGLAYFTFAVAERTTELVGSSQRLETAATGELSAGREQARAATATALEAQKNRIDALAPIVDLQVDSREAHARQRGLSPSTNAVLSPGRQQNENPETLSLEATFNLRLQNFGRTPAFATFTHLGAAIGGKTSLVRIHPEGASVQFGAFLDYPGTMIDPFDPREIRFEIMVEGAMTSGAIDVIAWVGTLTLLQRVPGGWELNEDPLRIEKYEVRRRYSIGE